MLTQGKRATAATVTLSMDALAGAPNINPTDMEMTMETNTTTPRKGAMLLAIEPDALAKLGAVELFALYDALITLDGVVHGLSAQPRFVDEVSGRLNGAGDQLSNISQWMDDLRSEVCEAAKAKPEGQSARDTDWLEWVKVRHEVSFKDELVTLAAVVTEGASRVYLAEMEAKRNG